MRTNSGDTAPLPPYARSNPAFVMKSLNESLETYGMLNAIEKPLVVAAILLRMQDKSFDVLQLEGKSSPTDGETDGETGGETDAEIDREAKMKQGLKTLMEKTDARGILIINQKNLWAAIMCVLVFEYHVTEIDMKAFCRKMDEWGFGKESGYTNYCDYASIAKDSDYATRGFPDWRGDSTKHKRMVAAYPIGFSNRADHTSVRFLVKNN